MNAKLLVNSDYAAFVAELKARIQSALISEARAVNRDLILLYWDIGRGIVEKQAALGWGESVIEQLAKDLQKAFPGMRGFSTANLWAMRRVYMECGRDPIIQQLAEELEMKKGAAVLEQAEEAV
jgi:hypothetical protein